MIQYTDKRLTCAQKVAGDSLVYHIVPKTKTTKQKKLKTKIGYA